jgi:hypothetical protein
MQNYTANPDFRIINLLFGLSAHFGKMWCTPSQAKIVELLGRFHGRHMTRSTLNRHLGGLVRDGWLQRLRRHRHEPGRGFVMHSTCYTFTRRAIRCLAGLRKGLRFLGAETRAARGVEPCPIPATISVLTGQDKGPGARSSPPGTPQKDPLAMLADLKGILRRK